MGTVSKSLELPDGYQRWDWYKEGANKYGVYLNDMDGLISEMDWCSDDEIYIYTQHEIYQEEGIFKQTRSSPNWEGGLVTYSTCKHNMRTWNRGSWKGVWIMGLCPRHCADNAVLFAGKVAREFPSNYELRRALKQSYPEVLVAKSADNNPRGDIYTPRPRKRTGKVGEFYDHNNFLEPPNHTRSLEYYSKSPGSVSTREDNKIPKWWRDIEYISRSGRRPLPFILSPCYLFSKPLAWVALQPGRAVLHKTVGEVEILGHR